MPSGSFLTTEIHDRPFNTTRKRTSDLPVRKRIVGATDVSGACGEATYILVFTCHSEWLTNLANKTPPM